ncbi:hypothetical protein S83_069829 [Arachis hypogaea]
MRRPHPKSPIHSPATTQHLNPNFRLQIPVFIEVHRRPPSLPVNHNRRRLRAAVTGQKELQRAEGNHRCGSKVLSAASSVGRLNSEASWSASSARLVVGSFSVNVDGHLFCRCELDAFSASVLPLCRLLKSKICYSYLKLVERSVFIIILESE